MDQRKPVEPCRGRQRLYATQISRLSSHTNMFQGRIPSVGKNKNRLPPSPIWCEQGGIEESMPSVVGAALTNKCFSVQRRSQPISCAISAGSAMVPTHFSFGRPMTLFRSPWGVLRCTLTPASSISEFVYLDSAGLRQAHGDHSDTLASGT